MSSELALEDDAVEAGALEDDELDELELEEDEDDELELDGVGRKIGRFFKLGELDVSFVKLNEDVDDVELDEDDFG